MHTVFSAAFEFCAITSFEPESVKVLHITCCVSLGTLGYQTSFLMLPKHPHPVTYKAEKESVINNGERELKKRHMWHENLRSITSGKRQYQKVIIKDTQTRIGTGGWRKKDKHDRQRKFRMEINKRHNTE